MKKLNSFIKSKKNKIRKTMKGGMKSNDNNEGNYEEEENNEYSQDIDNEINQLLDKFSNNQEERKKSILTRIRNFASRRLGKIRNSARTLGTYASRRLGKVRNGFGRGLNTVRRNISERFSRGSSETLFYKNKKKIIETFERMKKKYDMMNSQTVSHNNGQLAKLEYAIVYLNYAEELKKYYQHFDTEGNNTEGNNELIRLNENYDEKYKNSIKDLKKIKGYENDLNTALDTKEESVSKRRLSNKIRNGFGRLGSTVSSAFGRFGRFRTRNRGTSRNNITLVKPQNFDDI
jgi:hypothetical protein